MTRATLRAWLREMRVNQWTKNGFVMTAWFFSVADASQSTLVRGWRSFLMAFAMAGAFSLISSAFYLLNDVADYESDRLHPVKRHRPVAAGLIDRIDAVRVALVLFAVGFAYPAGVILLLPSRTIAFGTVLAYTVMQCLYTGFLKRVPFVDVATLAAGFVLRAVAGAAIIDAYISPWLLVCTFTLAMFLALCKRKHEREFAKASRDVLKRYHPLVLDLAIVFTGLASVLEYLAYTLHSAMGHRFPYLWATAVFVFLGIARYCVLAWGKGDTGRPEKVLLTDRMLWLILIGYAVSSISVVLLCR